MRRIRAAEKGILITVSDEVERGAKFEFTLAAIAQNLRRLARRDRRQWLQRALRKRRAAF